MREKATMYYVMFGNNTQNFVIASFKNDQTGAHRLCDTINNELINLNPEAFATCHVTTYDYP